MLTYLDRVCFATAAPQIRDALGIVSEGGLKWAFTAFAITYAIFEVPSGWWGDRFGPRKVLIRVVLWWSLFTALTGLVGLAVGGIVLGGLGLLVLIRLMFGAGEAGAYPNIARALHSWFPAEERGSAIGKVWAAGRLMGGLTPLIWTFIAVGTPYTPALLSWRAAFVVFGGFGILWCFFFARYFRNTPAEHPEVNDAERTLIESQRGPEESHHGVPWRKILWGRNQVALYLMYFATTYGWYFYISYLPSCLESGYGVEPTSLIGAVYKGAPLWVGALGCIIGGYLTDHLIKSGVSRRWARRGPGVFGLLLSAVFYLVAASVPEAWMFAAAIAMSAFFTDLMMGSAWAACQDLGGRFTGVVAGCMNTIGSLGAASAGFFSGKVLEWYLHSHAQQLGTTAAELTGPDKTAALLEGYQANLFLFAGIALIAAILWFFIDADKPIGFEKKDQN
jgi:ACS family glucarate transporter-like MFS transporter